MPKNLNLGGFECFSRMLTRKGAISLMNAASVAGSVFKVGMTNSVKAIFAASSSRDIEKLGCGCEQRVRMNCVLNIQTSHTRFIAPHTNR